MSLTPRAIWLSAAAAASALVLPLPLAVGILVVIVVVGAVDAWTVREVPELDRSLPPLLSRGVSSRLTIVPLRPWPGIRIRQPVADPDLRVEPPEGEGSLDAEIVALRRGRHRVPPAATRTVGPLGLGAWYHRSGPQDEIVVYPDLTAARRLAMDVRTGRFREEGRRSRGPLGLGTEFESIREYQPDDDIRQVNWTVTARLGHPMSTVFRIEQDRDVLCLVDCGRLMAAPVAGSNGDPKTRVDIAVDAVAAMAAVAEEVGDRIGVVAFAERVIRSVPPRRDNTSTVLHAVHDLEPVLADADYDAAFRVVMGMRRAFVLVLTDLLDETAGEPLLRALPLLVRRHAVAVAAVRDVDLAASVLTPADSVAEAVETAVAVEILERRAQLTSRLTHLGAEVVDAAPDSLSARVVAAYLRAKRHARL